MPANDDSDGLETFDVAFSPLISKVILRVKLNFGLTSSNSGCPKDNTATCSK